MVIVNRFFNATNFIFFINVKFVTFLYVYIQRVCEVGYDENCLIEVQFKEFGDLFKIVVVPNLINVFNFSCIEIEFKDSIYSDEY